MMDKEKIYSWIDRKSCLFTFGGLITSLVALVISLIFAWEKFGGIVGKMIAIILSIVIIAISFFGVIIFAIGLIRKPLINNLNKKDEELGAKTKKYNELIERVKLPETLDKAITVEIDPIWDSIGHNIIYPHHSKLPHLHFDMRVVNRTFYSFEAEKATAGCFCDGEEVCNGTWDKKIGKSGTFEKVSPLPKFADGSIVFHCPIKKLYDNIEKWKLEGTVKYRSKEPLIDDNSQYANPEIGIRLEYMLSEKQMSELKEKVEKALGDEG
jgi:hypothetical protein